MSGFNKEKRKRKLGLYIHIPFCVRKCDYCDFLSAPATEETKKDYIDALIAEIESYEGRTKEFTVATIFFGGGTPSCVDAQSIQRVMEKAFRVFHIDKENLEATIEVNPGTVTKEMLCTYIETGINRLSFGLQSCDNRELQKLGRIHSYEEFEDNYKLAREVGFRNINVDLMSALPGQTVESWENTLKKVIGLKPEHISAYSLIIEEGTRFYELYHDPEIAAKELPDEETDRLIYHRTKELMEENGYYRYEISNYAKRGYACKHNCSYWIGRDYLGLGLGASSLLNGARYNNLHDIKHYIRLCEEYKNRLIYAQSDNNNPDNCMDLHLDNIGIRENYELLTKEQRMEEFMFLGLRICQGISKEAFRGRFDAELYQIYGDVIRKLLSEQLLIEDGDFLRLSEYGLDVSNSVFYQFLLN